LFARFFGGLLSLFLLVIFWICVAMIVSIEWLWTGAQGEMGLPVHLANLGIADSYKTILEDIGRINGWLLLGF